MYIGDSLAGGEMKKNNKLFFMLFTAAFIADHAVFMFINRMQETLNKDLEFQMDVLPAVPGVQLQQAVS